jgi:hypothetical protein
MSPVASVLALRPCRPVLLAFLFGAISAGCASTPKQAVELSVTVGRDIESVHSAHVALAGKYFDRMESDVNRFVDTKYRPYCIEKSMQDFRLVERIKDPSAAEGLDPLDVMQIFVEGITKEIEDYRARTLAPIRAQRKQVMTSLENAYRQIQDGQSIVTGHLASILKVQDAQDAVLSEMNLAGLRAKTVDAIAAASDRIEDLTLKATVNRGKLEGFKDTAAQLEKATQSIGK